MYKIVLFIILTTNLVMGQDPIYHNLSVDLKSGQRYALFGDDVKFREAPDVKSQVIALLKIGTEVEILEKTSKTVLYNGIESPFYKVNYKGKTGYVLGGLISLEKKKTENATYLFAYQNEEFKYTLLIRALRENQSYEEISASLGSPGLSIDLMSNKGIKGIQHILRINNEPQACGELGGKIYFFETANQLQNVFATMVSSDAGVYWYNEELIFPEEDGGVADRIVYLKEQGEYGDEATNETSTTIVRRELRWENGAIFPKIEKE